MDVEGCALPEDRLYDLESDVWLRPEEGGASATVGVTGALASFAGRFQSVTYRAVDGVIERGRSVATVESIRFTGAVRMPVAGTIVARNDAIVHRPKLLNDEPFGSGWVVKITPSRPDEAPRVLESAGQVRERFAARVRDLHIRCYPAAPDVELYEIGAECAAILARVDEELAPRAAGDVLLLVTDDPTSPIEMVRWSDRTGHQVLAHRVEDRLHHFLIRRAAQPRPRRR